MGVTIELQNLGDHQLCQEIRAQIDHAFSDRQGDWRVSISGSRAAENWDLNIEGPNAFERTYVLAAPAGEHEPQAIRNILLQLAPNRQS